VLENFSGMLKRFLNEGISLDIAMGEDVGRVAADPAQIEQVLMNLVLNSRDAITSRGEISIETRNVVFDEEFARAYSGVQPGRYVMLAVTDTGSGIEKKTISHVFEPFFTTKPVGKGTGLGLSIVHGIVKQFHGHIVLHSHPGRGTSFEIYFPRVDETPMAKPLDITQALPTGTETVLLLEENGALRQVISVLLEREGYRVLQAENSQEAVAIATNHSGVIDLLLTDVVMSEMSGFEAVAHIRESHPEINVVFISSYAGSLRAHHAGLEPSSRSLRKPFTKEELLACVRRALDPGNASEKIA
jgi:CheY-like chemotaxis protein